MNTVCGMHKHKKLDRMLPRSYPMGMEGDSKKMEFNYNDGGRSTYFKAKNVDDSATRAIAIAMKRDYKEVYDELNRMAREDMLKRHKKGSSRDGLWKGTWKRYLKDAGWIYVPTCKFGSHEKKMALVDGALPPRGRFIIQLSGHLTTLIDNVINDTYDCSRQQFMNWMTGEVTTNDERCIYGYWREPTREEAEAAGVAKATKDAKATRDGASTGRKTSGHHSRKGNKPVGKQPTGNSGGHQ